MESSYLNSLNPNKHLKEQSVSNLGGSSMLEIAVLSTVVPLLFVLRHAICSNHNHTGSSTKKDDDSGAVLPPKTLGTYMATVTVDFLLIVLPMLLVFTVLAEWVYMMAIALMVLIFFIIAAKRLNFFSPSSDSGESLLPRTYISSYRVLVMVMTCLCILAVDFTIFPRRFSKTETYGTSLMDLGVGSFIFANSLVSRQARSVSSVSWKAAIRSASPLLLLGFGRLLSTKGVDYQVHIGEYGVHWNFFFTLAAVSILTSIINIQPQYSGILGVAILIGFQYWLIHGLNMYLLSDKRGIDILSKNKEGICSVLGYWGLYLIGAQLGYYLFFGNCSSTTLRTNKWVMVRASFLSLMFWLITFLLDRHVERVSRRMCNLSYVTLVLAENLQAVAILMLSDFIPGSKISALEEAYNRNLLASFLLANVLTGLVNLQKRKSHDTTVWEVLALRPSAWQQSILQLDTILIYSDSSDHGPRSSRPAQHQSSSWHKAAVPALSGTNNVAESKAFQPRKDNY